MLYLGLDLGTSSVKAVILDEKGGVVATGRSAHPTVSTLPGQREQEPASWLDAAGAAVGEALCDLDEAGRGRIAAIGLTGQLPTLVCLGENGPLGPAIAWADCRADAWAEKRFDRSAREELYRLTGMPIDGRYLAPMFRFHWWERRSEVRHILSAKDYLCFALTGRRVTDASTAAGYATYALEAGDWSEELCALWELDPALLPALAPSDAVAGGLDAAGARLLGLPEGLPVMVGAADSVAGALALSGVEEGVASIMMGSSTIIIAAADKPHLDGKGRYLVTPHAAPGRYGREMDLLSTGTGFDWLGNLLGLDDPTFEAEALRAPPGANGLTFAPYLAGGEQGALWDRHLTGVLHGLGLRHGRSDMARAYFEGCFFEMRRCLAVLEETGPIKRVVVSGDAAGNPALVALLSDVLDKPVQPFTLASASAIGAAILASGGAVTVPAQAFAGGANPGPNARVYRELYHHYTDLFPRLAAEARAMKTRQESSSCT
ncbi:xylulokinase [Labrys neptuniae]